MEFMYNLNVFSNKFLIIGLIKLIMLVVWGFIGFLLYNKSSIFKKFIDNRSLHEIILVTYFTILIIYIILNLSFDLFTQFYIVSNCIESIDFSWFTGEGANAGSSGVNSNSSGVSNTSSNIPYASWAGDVGIMTAGIYAGSQVAKNIPSTAGKKGVILSGAAVGAAGIVVKNVAGNVSENIGKNNFITSSDKAIEVLKSFFNLSGNNGLDLLNLIQICNGINISLLISMFYLLFCLCTDENKIRLFIFKIFPLFMANYFLKIYTAVKKRSLILIVILLLLNLFSNYLAYYYLGFFIDNIDKIVELYFK